MGSLGLAYGLGSSIASGVKSKEAAEQAREDYKEKQNLIANQMAADEAWFNKQYYQDITQRTDVQNMLRKLDEQQKKQQTANEARAAVMGATPEARLAAQDSVNKSHANAVAEIASNASALKDQYLNNWRNRQNDYFRMRIGLENPETAIKANEAAQWGQAGTNAILAGSNMMASGLGKLGTDGTTATELPNANIQGATSTTAAPTFARSTSGMSPWLLSGNMETYGKTSLGNNHLTYK